ncbi:hypothetical protein [Oceanivirga miroungae]|uniref:hypothetical protein n=1 Tax=Oceanivirga miroungae TaxID=1130046 RepID=UPI001E388F2E|nr:hypothetical protein [Oceanivirga miroungae]
MNKLKIIINLKINKLLKLSIFAFLLSYFLTLYNNDIVYFLLLSWLYLIYNLVLIYYKNTKIILNFLLALIDLIYISLFSFNLMYILVYLFITLFLTYRDRENMKNNIEFYLIYTIVKIIFIILLILI